MNFAQPFFTRYKLFFVAAFVVAFGLFGHAGNAEAASLFFSPSSGTYNVGQDFSVSVYVSSADQAMNATQGVVNFPSDRLQVTGLSKAGSIMSLWVQEPTFSNSAGSVNFEGIVLNPGFTGNTGKILTISFKVKAAGSGTLSFTSGSVLANDGQGTNILSGLASANFSLVASVAPEKPTQPSPQTETVKVPAAPTVTSPTHPDQNKWYPNASPKFEWVNPKGTTGVNVLADREPTTDPGTKSDGVMTNYAYTDVDEGTWYFHIRLKNDQGWGKVTHFAFHIDVTKPELLTVEEVKPEGAKTTERKFQIVGTDKVSGIDFYDVKIDNNASVIWHDDGSHIFTTGELESGKHNIVVKAVDKAGNSLITPATFEVVAPAVAPVPEPTPAPFFNFGRQMANILIIVIPSFFFLLVLFLLLYHIWKKLHDIKKRVRKEIRDVEISVHDAFQMLHNDMKKHLKLLESAKTKRDLTREEEKIMAQMKQDIELAEKIVSKEIEDIKDEVK